MLKARYAACAVVFMGAGCVPLTDYKKLEERYKEQEIYVQKHKDEITEFQKREQLLTMQMRDKEREKELALARLAEFMRRGGEPRVVATDVPASANKENEAVFGGFRINPSTGGIVLEHDVLFAPGKHEIKVSGKKILDEIVSKLNGSELSKYSIRIDGHTDDAPVVKTVKENHDNWELGFKRAKAVFDYMVSKGIPQGRCFLASFGPFRPMVAMPTTIKHHTKKGEKVDASARSQNRRVEIVLFEKKG